MTDAVDLLKQRGAPLPNAIEMETEIRSQGILAVNTVNVPDWTENLRLSGVLFEWRCTLEAEDITQLREFLKTIRAGARGSVQQLINEAFRKIDVGYYLGTFIEEGLLIDGAGTIRVLFAYRSDKFKAIEEFKRAIHDFLVNPDQAVKEASDSLKELRNTWRKGTNKWEGGMMMLSELEPFASDRFPFTAARLA